jgi:hypothetical protein
LTNSNNSNDLTVHDELTDQERREVVKQLAEFKDIPDVQEYIKEKFSKSLAYNSVKFYLKSKKWQPLLERLRKEYVQPIMSIPVAHKFIRLKRRESLYQACSMTGKIKECRELLNDAKDEVEGPRTNPSGDLFITQINKFSDEDLNKRKNEILFKLREIDIIDAKAKNKDK